MAASYQAIDPSKSFCPNLQLATKKLAATVMDGKGTSWRKIASAS